MTNKPNLSTPAIVVGEQLKSLNDLANIALSLSSSSSSFYTPQKRKVDGDHGKVMFLS